MKMPAPHSVRDRNPADDGSSQNPPLVDSYRMCIFMDKN